MAQDAQSAYWAAVRKLEILTHVEFDGEDLSTYSVEDLVKEEGD